MKAMILAAGMGKRMGNLTLKKPKPLTILKSKPLIEHTIIKIRKAGIKDIVINVSWLGDQIMNWLGSGKKYKVNIKIRWKIRF